MSLRSLGVIAITALVFGAMFWSVLVLSNWMIWPFLAMMLFGFSQSAGRALTILVSEQFQAQTVGLLVLGAAIIVLAGMRLYRLNEDMPEYHRRMPTRWAAKGRMAGQNVNYDGPWPRVVMDWFREQAMAHVTRHVECAGSSPWSRICRWQVGMPTGWRVWLWGLLAIGFLQFMDWHFRQPMTNGGKPSIMMVANTFVFFTTMLVVGQLAGWLMLRTRTLGYELMLPVDRRSYVRQLSVALALCYFQLWGVICATITGWWLVAVRTPPPLSYLGSLAAAALLMQIFQFGVIVFAYAITSHRIVHVAAFMVPMFGSMLLLIGGAGAISNRSRKSCR